MDVLDAMIGGPGRLRLVIQPLIAILLGIRDGRKDAEAGRPPYVIGLLLDRGWRAEELSTAIGTLAKPLAFAFVIDLVLQFVIFGYIRCWIAMLVGFSLIALPYSITRALSTAWLADDLAAAAPPASDHHETRGPGAENPPRGRGGRCPEHRPHRPSRRQRLHAAGGLSMSPGGLASRM